MVKLELLYIVLVDTIDVDAERLDFLGKQHVRDLVETGLFSKLLAILAHEDTLDIHIPGNRVFIDQLTENNHLAFTLHSVHRSDAHVWALCVLSTPLVCFGIAMDNVPTQIVHRDHLRGEVWLVTLWPYDLPVAVVVYQL